MPAPSSPPLARRTTTPVGVGIGSLVAGSCWFAQCLVPWTASGVLSQSTMVDTVRLVHTGALDAVLGPGGATALLVLPGTGLLLVSLAAIPGPVAAGLRAAISGLGILMALVLLQLLGDLSPARLGAGGWLSLAGLGAAAVTLAAQARHQLRRDRRPRRAVTPPRSTPSPARPIQETRR